MGAPSIIQKLRDYALCENMFKRQSDVVYFNVEVRKLLDHQKNHPIIDSEELKIISMVCNWTVHTNLSYENTIKDFVLYLDRAEKDEIQEYFNKSLREALGTYLSYHFLTEDNFTKHDSSWAGYLGNLLAVIAEQPVCVRGDLIHDTKIAKIKIIEASGEESISNSEFLLNIEDNEGSEINIPINLSGVVIPRLLIKSIRKSINYARFHGEYL